MANESIPLINGKAHDWASIEFGYKGVVVSGVTAIKYGETREKKDNYGLGTRPVSRGYGQVSATASITMLAEEVAALESASPNGDITLLPPVDVNVLFIPVGSTVATKHVLRNFEFKENGRDAKAGDTGIEVPMECIISDIDWGKKK
jgi:hypothetical protein